jgi:anthranilate synthase/aminodeoxychorismate synthase-like glutamine amidotransferase
VGTILVIDNYDSFTWNLVQEMGEIGAELEVIRNDAASVDEIDAMRPAGIVLSPGPGRPEDAGVSCEVVRRLGPHIPILGVCLGHQAIGVVYGATIGSAPTIMHGKTSDIHHDGLGVFADVPNPFVATRYHSLVINPDSVPTDLVVTARTADGIVMGVRHHTHPLEGVQFHPESVLTTDGPRLLANFLAGVARATSGAERVSTVPSFPSPAPGSN